MSIKMNTPQSQAANKVAKNIMCKTNATTSLAPAPPATGQRWPQGQPTRTAP